MNMVVEIVVCALLLLGGAFVLLGSFGLMRLPDFFCRLHTPTKATTLGMSCLLIASMIFFSISNHWPSVHEILITLFLLITAPVSAYMLAKTALHHHSNCVSRTQGQSLFETARLRRNPLHEEPRHK